MSAEPRPPEDTDRPRPGRARRILLTAGFVVAFLVAAVLFTLLNTALNANWYRDAVDANHGYDRLYDKVLVDPQVARETRDLLAGLPIDHSLIAANVRLVLPPAAVRASINRALDSMVGYLRGNQSTFDPIFALEPVFDRISKLADLYLSDTITNLRPLEAKNVGDFAYKAVGFANDLGAGRRPAGLPTVAFAPEQAGSIADILLQPHSAADRQRLILPVTGALESGDLGTAIATVAPAYGQVHTDQVIVDLRQDAHGTHLRINGTVPEVDKATAVIDLSRIRFLTGTLLPILLLGSFVAAGACLIALGRLARRTGRHGPLVASVVVIATGVAVFLLYVIVRLILGDPFAATFGHSGLPPQLHSLLGDIATSLFHGLDKTFAETILIAVVPATAVVVWFVIVPRFVHEIHTIPPRTMLTIAGAVALVLAVGFGSLAVVTANHAETRQCNGHAELCNRRYDQVAFPEAHNAMSASDLGWLGANQDVPIPEQLSAGVRVLHLDTRYWETPDVTASFASTLQPDLQNVVLAAAEAANPVRPGLWLCHALCRLGSTKFSTGMGQISDFLRNNPNEVVTLDLEDKTAADQTSAAIRRSPLGRYLYTPGDPQKPWPTLGQMIKSGHRVVVFSENHGGTPRWYAPLYKYAMETPFTFTNPSQFSCKKNRGGTGKRLFVMNNFITRDAPSRNDAAAVNMRGAIVRRADRCAAQRKHMVNFVHVDFSTLGDVTGAVNQLNHIKS